VARRRISRRNSFSSIDVLLALAFLMRYSAAGHKDVAAGDEILHLAVERRSAAAYGCAEPSTVGVGHDDDLAVSAVGDTKSSRMPVPSAVIMQRISSC